MIGWPLAPERRPARYVPRYSRPDPAPLYTSLPTALAVTGRRENGRPGYPGRYSPNPATELIRPAIISIAS